MADHEDIATPVDERGQQAEDMVDSKVTTQEIPQFSNSEEWLDYMAKKFYGIAHDPAHDESGRLLLIHFMLKGVWNNAQEEVVAEQRARPGMRLDRAEVRYMTNKPQTATIPAIAPAPRRRRDDLIP